VIHLIWSHRRRMSELTKISSVLSANRDRAQILIFSSTARLRWCRSPHKECGRTDLMCRAPSPSYRIMRRSNRFSKHWRLRQQRFSNILISRFSSTILCSPPIRGANTDSPTTGTPERPPSLLLPRYLRAASNSARTPQRGCLATVWIHASAGTADARPIHH
jgi:hypothetical protein